MDLRGDHIAVVALAGALVASVGFVFARRLRTRPIARATPATTPYRVAVAPVSPVDTRGGRIARAHRLGQRSAVATVRRSVRSLDEVTTLAFRYWSWTTLRNVLLAAMISAVGAVVVNALARLAHMVSPWVPELPTHILAIPFGIVVGVIAGLSICAALGVAAWALFFVGFSVGCIAVGSALAVWRVVVVAPTQWLRMVIPAIVRTRHGDEA